MVGCLFPGLAQAQTAEQKQATVQYLQKLAMADGGFLPAQPGPASSDKAKSSLRAMASGIRALKYFGGELPNPARSAEFLQRCHDKRSGGFADQPGGEPNVAVTAVGLMAAVELNVPPDRFQNSVINYLGKHVKSFDDIRIAAAAFEAIGKPPAEAKEWLKRIEALRNPDGTYGKGDGVARDTGSAVAAVLRLGGEVQQRDNALQALKQGQRADGGFGKANTPGSDLESTYRVMRAFVMLKEKPNDVAGLQAFVAKCRNADGGYGVTPGLASSVSGTYYAAIIRPWLGKDKP
jgi:prenyltransferase beta subunit